MTTPERVGPYKILQKLGEGGMGVVYLAEQEKPIRRRVALKVIKLGMDTKQVIARFEAERQALAMMDHPNIAKILDAGATSEGRPYFAMEHVQGVAITDYCDRHELKIRERLELFTHICETIQHAHQKGVIHRDLKPSNILVSVVDSTPVPKVIDFGVAKAMAQRLTERTVYTELGQLIGTPEYMSPEQAEMTGLNIDTRTDIYSLGVLLYELLAGALPFDPQTLRSANYSEIQRILREVDPPRPSVRLSSLGAASNDVANRRRIDRSALLGQLRGDLDWITMKALDKDRTRRYASASEFAADIRRFLQDEPILARPPSVTYQMRKMMARHRGPVAVGVLFVAVILIALVTSITLWHRAETEGTNARFRLETARLEVSKSFEEYQDIIPQLRRAEDLAALLPREIHQRYPESSPATTYLEATEWITGLFPTTPDSVPVTGYATLNSQIRGAILSCAKYPDRSRNPAAVAWVRANRDGVNRLVGATRQHRFDLASSSGGDLLVHTLLPSLRDARFGVEVLTASALIHHDEGNSDEVIENLDAAMRISRYVGDGATLISRLAEIACRNTIHNAYRWMVIDALASGPLPPGYVAFIRQSPPLPDYEHSYISEVRTLRQMLNEAFVRTSDRASARLDLARLREMAEEWGGDENPFADPSQAMIADANALDYEQAISIITELCNRVRVQQNASFREIRAEGDRVMRELQDNHPALRSLMPDFTRALELLRESQMNWDATVIAVALGVFQHSKGGWPASIDDALIAFEPEPFYRNYYGHDFVYRIIDGAPLLYAVGPNNIDDGGRGRRYEDRRDTSAAGDDVLFLVPQNWHVRGPDQPGED